MDSIFYVIAAFTGCLILLIIIFPPRPPKQPWLELQENCTHKNTGYERGFGARPYRRCFACDKIVEDE